MQSRLDFKISSTKENYKILKKLQIDAVAPAKSKVIKTSRSYSSEGDTAKELTIIQQQQQLRNANSRGQWPKILF